MVAAASRGVLLPAASASRARVASSAAREKRVGGRNSRTSSHERACSTAPRRAAPRRLAEEAASTAVQMVARAAATPRVSRAASARSACASARCAIRSSGCSASALSTELRTRPTALEAAALYCKACLTTVPAGAG
jgi:hypothetical protein